MAKANKPTIVFNDKAIMDAVAENCWGDIEAAGQAVAAAVQIDAQVKTMMQRNRSGRPVCLVTIMHPKGMASQAKHGTLTRAAASTGLEITRYGEA